MKEIIQFARSLSKSELSTIKNNYENRSIRLRTIRGHIVHESFRNPQDLKIVSIRIFMKS